MTPPPSRGRSWDLTRLGQLGKEGVPGLAVRLHQPWNAPATPAQSGPWGPASTSSSRAVRSGSSSPTFASNVDRIPADRQRGRQLWPESGRHRPEHGETPCGWPPNWGTPTSPKGSWWTSTTSSPLPKDKGVYHHHRQPGGGHVRPLPHRLLHPQAGGDPGRGPGDHLRLRRPRQRELRQQYHQRTVPEKGRGWSARTPAPLHVSRPRLPGRAEDHPRPGFGPSSLSLSTASSATSRPTPKWPRRWAHPRRRTSSSPMWGRVIELTHNSAQLAGNRALGPGVRGRLWRGGM